jgi:hypothetical protein
LCNKVDWSVEGEDETVRRRVYKTRFPDYDVLAEEAEPLKLTWGGTYVSPRKCHTAYIASMDDFFSDFSIARGDALYDLSFGNLGQELADHQDTARMAVSLAPKWAY